MNNHLASQMRVSAKDQGVPVRSSQAQITVNIRRSQFPPVFDRSVYELTVSENVRIGNGIATVRATDQDAAAGALVYEVRGVRPAPQYFKVDPSSGALFVDGDILNDFSLTYTVSYRSGYTCLMGV